MSECKQRLVSRRRCRKYESQASVEKYRELRPTEYVNVVVIVNTSLIRASVTTIYTRRDTCVSKWDCPAETALPRFLDVAVPSG
jgi:hypothetical protein